MEEHPLEIQGAWIVLLTKLWWSETRGEATKTLDEWSRILRETRRKTSKILAFFEQKHVADIKGLLNQNGNQSITIKSRRMVKDNYISLTRAACGRKGGSPHLTKNKTNLDKQTVKQNPTLPVPVPVPVPNKEKESTKKKKKWDADAWRVELAIIADYSNILSQCTQLNNPLKTTIGRKTLTAIRIRSEERKWRGNAHWVQLFERCSRSEFLMSGSWFNLPWIVNPTNMEKIEMGNYVEKTSATEDKPKPVYTCSRPGCGVETENPWHVSGEIVYCSQKCKEEAADE